VSDLSELFEQLADGPVLLATAFDSVDADCDNGAVVPCQGGGRWRSGCEARLLAAVARPQL
jgi:hypothetical protein